jgi:hypothetical protein
MNTDTNTTAVLTAVRRAVEETIAADGADTGLPQVLAAARTRRRRRRVTAYGSAAGAGLAFSAALTLALGTPGANPRASLGGTAARPGAAGTANPAGVASGAASAAGPSVSLAAWSVRAGRGGSVTVTLRELADAARLRQALAANGVPALLHFGRGPCSADQAPQRGPIGVVRVRAAGGHLTFTMTFRVSLWPARSELYIANGPLGPQPAVIPQGHYRGCA